MSIEIFYNHVWVIVRSFALIFGFSFGLFFWYCVFRDYLK